MRSGSGIGGRPNPVLEAHRSSFEQFFTLIGQPWSEAIEFVCSGMWQPYLRVIRERCTNAVIIPDHFPSVAKMNDALDKRAAEAPPPIPYLPRHRNRRISRSQQGVGGRNDPEILLTNRKKRRILAAMPTAFLMDVSVQRGGSLTVRHSGRQYASGDSQLSRGPAVWGRA